MRFLIPTILVIFFGLSFMFLNSKSIEVYDHGKLIVKVDDFPHQDTIINVKDYYITCRKSFLYLEGDISSNFQESKARYRTPRKLIVDINETDLKVNTSVF